MLWRCAEVEELIFCWEMCSEMKELGMVPLREGLPGWRWNETLSGPGREGGQVGRWGTGRQCLSFGRSRSRPLAMTASPDAPEAGA